MTDRKKDDYEVGYRKPPKKTRFKPGQSGNPKGRPKGARNFHTVFAEELASSVSIMEEGRARRVSKREVVAKQLVNKAAAGDPKATALLLAAARQFESTEEDTHREVLEQPIDQVVMESIVQRIRGERHAGEVSPNTSSDQGDNA